MSVDWQQYLHLLQQATDPNEPLANSIQLWMDATKHLQARLHEEGDPGANNLYKLLDFTYATFFGVEEAVTSAATINITAGAFNLVTCTIDQDATINITGGTAGQRLYFVLKQDATGNRMVTFGTGFNDYGDRSEAADNYMRGMFIYDGTTWHEVGGQGSGGIRYGVAFTWVFKLVDATDFGTPEIGASPTVEISQDGGAFASLAGAPSVSEISDGFYKVTVATSDMSADYIILIAEEVAVTAQQAKEIYTVRG